MAIQCKNGNLSRITYHLQPRNITVRINRQLQLASLTTTYVKTHNGNMRVIFACNRILIGIKTWIIGKLITDRFQTFIERHGVFLYFRFIISHPYQLFTIGSKNHGTIQAKLLLINPIWNTIYYLIALSILCNLNFSIIIHQFYKKDIIASDKSNLQTIWRK